MEANRKSGKHIGKAGSGKAGKPRREHMMPVIWEMSALDALQVNYLTRTNKSIRA